MSVEDAYARLNNRPGRPFNLAARQGMAATKLDLSRSDTFNMADYFKPESERDQTPTLAQFLERIEDRSHDDQYDTVRGVVRAWNDTLPGQMVRIAGQYSTLVRQNWVGYGLVAPLVEVTEKFGHFARAHDNDLALNIVDSALRSQFQLDLLSYVLWRGVEKANNMPKEAAAPSVLRLAA